MECMENALSSLFTHKNILTILHPFKRSVNTSVEGARLIWYVLKRMLKIPILKIFSVKTFNAKSSIRHWSFKRKKQKLQIDFHFRYSTSFSHICQVAAFRTVSPLLVHKEKEGKNP